MLTKTLNLTDYINKELESVKKSASINGKDPLELDDAITQKAKSKLQIDMEKAKSFGYTVVSTGNIITLTRDDVVSFDFSNISEEDRDALLGKLYSEYWDISKGWKEARLVREKLLKALKVWSTEQSNHLNKRAGRNCHRNTSYSAWESHWTGLDFSFYYVLDHNNWKSEEEFRFTVVDYNRSGKKNDDGTEMSVIVGHYRSIEEAVIELNKLGYTLPSTDPA